MEKYQLADTTKYQRDRHSKALLANDAGALKAYKTARERAKEIKAYGDDINNLKTEMTEIKLLLQKILERNSGEV